MRTVPRLAACAAIAVGVTALAALGLAADIGANYQRRAADNLQPRGEVGDAVAVVAIDERSLDELDASWPWPRELQAELVRRIDDAGARVVVLDIVYDQPTNGDGELAAALAETDAVIGVGAQLTTDAELYRGVLVERRPILPVDDLADAATLGHTAALPDSADGVLRSSPLAVDTGRAVLPSLALAASMRLHGDEGPLIPAPEGKGVQVGDRRIPTDRRAALRISYPPELVHGGFGAPIHSAADVMGGSIGRDELDGRVVFVGTTAAFLGDVHITPVGGAGNTPGVLVQAATFDTIEQRVWLEPIGDGAQLALVAAVALTAALVVQFLRIRWSAPFVVALAFGVWALFGWANAGGHIVDPVYPTVALVFAVPLAGASRFALEGRVRREVDALFSAYVGPQVAAQLLDPSALRRATAGERIEVTVLFCDLRGFTAMSTDLDPVVIRRALDHYYEFGNDIVLAHGGTLMNFVGDEIFAVFGAPLPDPDHADAAAACAAEMLRRCPDLDARLDADGLPRLRYGIGLNSGEVAAAHMGSRTRRQYTVIGDTVNVGARLCGKAPAGAVLLSDDVRDRLRRHAAGDTTAVDPASLTPTEALEMKGVRPDYTAWSLQPLGPDPG